MNVKVSNQAKDRIGRRAPALILAGIVFAMGAHGVSAEPITMSLAPERAWVVVCQPVTVDLRINDNTLNMAACRFDLARDPASTVTGVSVTARSHNPVGPNELSYLSSTAQEPFEANLPHDLLAGSLREVLLDLATYDGDGLPATPPDPVTVETLTLVPDGSAYGQTLVLGFDAASAATTQGNLELFSPVNLPSPLTLTLTVPADLDYDGDVDGFDSLTFSNCYNGALNPPSPICENANADLDNDGDVDGTDFLTFSNCMNGGLNPPGPNCPISRPGECGGGGTAPPAITDGQTPALYTAYTYTPTCTGDAVFALCASGEKETGMAESFTIAVSGTMPEFLVSTPASSCELTHPQAVAVPVAVETPLHIVVFPTTDFAAHIGTLKLSVCPAP